MQNDSLRIVSAPLALLWLFAIAVGGIAAALSIAVCWLMLRVGGLDAADKHGISDQVSSRVGGVIVVLYLFFNAFYLWFVQGQSWSSLEIAVLAFLSTYFAIGLFEDLTSRISSIRRFLFMLSAALVVVGAMNDLKLTRVDIIWVDWILGLSPLIAVGFTVLCLAFLSNAFNTADGANGLVGGIGLISLATLGLLVPSSLSSLQLAGAVGCLVFLTFNLYTGRFFLGDGGAYAIGALVGCSAVYLVGTRDISSWFILTLIFYPSADLLWGMARRFATGRSVLSADEYHLHNLIYGSLRSRCSSSVVANNATGLSIVTIFCLFPSLLAWLGLIPLDDSRWLHVALLMWLLYAGLWFKLSPLTKKMA